MGWANCGEDSQGRQIGYAHPATCDQPGCGAEIDRGLSYACGDMHGDDEVSCEKYFCNKHRRHMVERSNGQRVWICDECEKLLTESGDFALNDDGVLVDTR